MVLPIEPPTVLGPSGRGTAELDTKALFSGAMPANHASEWAA